MQHEWLPRVAHPLFLQPCEGAPSLRSFIAQGWESNTVRLPLSSAGWRSGFSDLG